MKEQSEYMLGAVYILGDRFSGLLKGPDLVCICRLVHVTRRRAEQAAGPGLVLVWRPAGFSPAVTAVTLVWCYVTHVMCNVRGVTPRLPDRGPVWNLISQFLCGAGWCLFIHLNISGKFIQFLEIEKLRLFLRSLRPAWLASHPCIFHKI